MKNWYIAAIVLVIIAFAAIITYRIDMPPFGSRKIMLPRNYNWSFSGASFITTFTDKTSPVTGAKTTHTCLAGNDESCFLITVWSGNYPSYFNSYRIALFGEMMAQSGSTLTEDDLKGQLAAGFHEVMSIDGLSGAKWHLVDIGMEAQHLYVERPWGTLIITDMLGLKGPSYEDRTYMRYTDMPKYIAVQ